MPKKFKKHPYSFSFSEKLIKKLPDDKLSQQVEIYLDALIPDIS